MDKNDCLTPELLEETTFTTPTLRLQVQEKEQIMDFNLIISQKSVGCKFF